MEILASFESSQRAELLNDVKEELIVESNRLGPEMTIANLVSQVNRILIAFNFNRTHDVCGNFLLYPSNNFAEKNIETFLPAVELVAIFLASNQEKYSSVKDVLNHLSKKAKRRWIRDMFIFLKSVELGTIEKSALVCLFSYLLFKIGCWRGANGRWLPKKMILNSWNNSA